MCEHLLPQRSSRVLAFALLGCTSLVVCAGGLGASATEAGPIISASMTVSMAGCAGISPDDLLVAINAARARGRQCGDVSLPPASAVAWNGALARAASRHASDMAVRNFFSHPGSDGSDVSQRASAAGYGWTSVAENIAGGPSSVAQVMSGWLSSPGHCANIMGAGFRDVGMACVALPGSRYTRYWSLVLARP
jgi:uncharacterized protein YkwD